MCCFGTEADAGASTAHIGAERHLQGRVTDCPSGWSLGSGLGEGPHTSQPIIGNWVPDKEIHTEACEVTGEGRREFRPLADCAGTDPGDKSQALGPGPICRSGTVRGGLDW